MKNFWQVTSFSRLPDGTKFVASIESLKYPFYATQFHPEKPSQIWTDGTNIDHTWTSIGLQELFAKEFVAAARQNPNSFGNFTEYMSYDIVNYPLIQTYEEMAEVYVF